MKTNFIDSLQHIPDVFDPVGMCNGADHGNNRFDLSQGTFEQHSQCVDEHYLVLDQKLVPAFSTFSVCSKAKFVSLLNVIPSHTITFPP